MSIITNLEYKRRVFNAALLECFTRIHRNCLIDESAQASGYELDMAASMAKAFYSETLKLDSNTINKTKDMLANSAQFVQDCISVCESIAADKADVAKQNDLTIPQNQNIELSPEDKDLIDKIFDEKNPKVSVDVIRDATVKALIAEDKKSQEIKAAVDMAQASGDTKTIEETVSRLSGRGPTSLMNAILNRFSAAAVKDVNEASGSTSVGDIMRENADTIKTRSVMLYTLYEMASVFGIKKFTPAEVKHISAEIYYNK